MSVLRSGRFVILTVAQALARKRAGLHVEWDEGVLYHYFPDDDPPPDQARTDGRRDHRRAALAGRPGA